MLYGRICVFILCDSYLLTKALTDQSKLLKLFRTPSMNWWNLRIRRINASFSGLSFGTGEVVFASRTFMIRSYARRIESESGEGIIANRNALTSKDCLYFVGIFYRISKKILKLKIQLTYFLRFLSLFALQYSRKLRSELSCYVFKNC